MVLMVEMIFIVDPMFFSVDSIVVIKMKKVVVVEMKVVMGCAQQGMKECGCVA